MFKQRIIVPGTTNADWSINVHHVLRDTRTMDALVDQPKIYRMESRAILELREIRDAREMIR